MLEHALLYFIPAQCRDDTAKDGEFLKIQPGTGDNLLREDIAEGYTNYVLWSTFKPECLDIDGELDMECLDSGMVLIKEEDALDRHGLSPRDDMDPIAALQDDILKEVLEQAYGDRSLDTVFLLGD